MGDDSDHGGALPDDIAQFIAAWLAENEPHVAARASDAWFRTQGFVVPHRANPSCDRPHVQVCDECGKRFITHNGLLIHSGRLHQHRAATLNKEETGE